jgi:nickel/cobalt transporter (NiCoT) family protein
MMLFDTLDGCFMNFAHGWAFALPVRKAYYTWSSPGCPSTGATFIIGTIEILGVLTTELHLHGGFWDTMADFNIKVAGFCIAALFVLVCAACSCRTSSPLVCGARPACRWRHGGRLWPSACAV